MEKSIWTSNIYTIPNKGQPASKREYNQDDAVSTNRVNGCSHRSAGLCIVPFGDDILYRMIYGLTEEEIKIVEGKE
jgi:hypothetical protein